MCHGPERDTPPDGPFQKNCNVLSISRSGKGTDPFCRNGPQDAAHKRSLSRVSRFAHKRSQSPFLSHTRRPNHRSKPC